MNSNKNRIVRVRIIDNEGFLTIKGISDKSGTTRFEWEKSIPLKEAKELMEIIEFLEQHKNERCIVLGDFNFDPDKTNTLTRKFKEWNYAQQITSPTHRDGNVIDHIYVSEELLEHSVCDLHYVYYSDHQGVCITLKNPPEC